MSKRIYDSLKVIRCEYILLSIILFISVVARLYDINSPLADWHSWRQADTASVSRIFVQEGIRPLYPRYYDISTIQTGQFNRNGYRFVEFPLFNILHAHLASSFPSVSLEVWGRIVSISCTLVSVLILYLMGRRLGGYAIGLLASFFYAILPFNIYFTRVILPEPMAVMLGLISIWLFSLFIDSKKMICIILSATAFSLAILTKPTVVFYAFPIASLAITEYGVKGLTQNRQLLAKLLLFGLIVLLPMVLWRWWTAKFPEGVPFWKWMFNEDGIRFRPSYWRWIFGERIGHLILGSWGLVVAVSGLLSMKSLRNNLFELSFFIGAILYLVVFATVNVRHDYYQTVIIPPIVLLLAKGTVYLWQSQVFNKLISRGILLFSLFVMLITSWLQVREFYKIVHPEILDAGKRVDEIIEKDALVIAPYNGDTAFLYHTKRFGWPYKDRAIEELISKGANYFVSVNIDRETQDIMDAYRVIERNEKYVIVDLHQPIEPRM